MSEQPSPLALADLVGLIAFSAGVERFFHERGSEDFPRVTTRGHIGLTRYGRLQPPTRRVSRCAGGHDTYIENGHDELDYGTRGEIPGFTVEASPDEVVVFVHGWLASEKAALGRMGLLRHNLNENGYDSPVIGFTWDTDHDLTRWKGAVSVANRNGPKLAQFVYDYKEENPETDVRLISNSLGANVLFEAVKTLHRSDVEPVRSASVLGGTVRCDSVSVDRRYGKAVERATEEFHNYWSENDRTLRSLYRFTEGEGAVGGEGGYGETPRNYTDHKVDVADHFSYYVPGRGCIEEVVSEFD
ncbi:MAG: DUF726 domain-containing protein [Halobacteria archaeon]|nr:DUF726 domain-containing protein [Halobacteria archaeon]